MRSREDVIPKSLRYLSAPKKEKEFVDRLGKFSDLQPLVFIQSETFVLLNTIHAK